MVHFSSCMLLYDDGLSAESKRGRGLAGDKWPQPHGRPGGLGGPEASPQLAQLFGKREQLALRSGSGSSIHLSFF